MCSALNDTSRSTLAIVYFTAAMSVRVSCVLVLSIFHAVSSTNRRSMRIWRVGVGDLLLHHLVLGDDLAVRLAAQGPLAHHVEGELALGDRAHGVVDATAAEAALGEHLGAVLRAEQVVEGDAHLVVDDVVVVAGLRLDLDAGRLARHDEHAVRAHDEEDVGDAAGAGEPLLAVDDPLVAVTRGVGLEQVRVRAALRLGHRVRRPHLLVEHRLEPALLLLLGAVGGEHLHVAGVGRGRSEHLRRRRVATEDLVQQAELELAVAGAAEVLVEEDRPEALGLDLVLQPLDERLDLRIRRPDGVGEHVLERLHLLTAELLDPVELLLELRLGGEVPPHS